MDTGRSKIARLDCMSIHVTVNDQPIRLQLCDTAGQEIGETSVIVRWKSCASERWVFHDPPGSTSRLTSLTCKWGRCIIIQLAAACSVHGRRRSFSICTRCEWAVGSEIYCLLNVYKANG
ncbi:hypothetical protein Tsp_08286 [Trichinella spiralis]|uniref:hypothetical protein n=1 Tax=Trichinella spiralis TaxID=6334 RepID=UPI0001EFCD16|nr:hypothetical protein Tsp_08286 [Trichinella spiralis]